MPDKFIDYSTVTIIWVFILSLLGGVANYFRKVSGGVIKRFSIAELVGDLFISGFVGFITFLLCDSAGFDVKLTAAIVGISGHMGSRAIFLLERLINKKVNKIVDAIIE